MKKVTTEEFQAGMKIAKKVENNNGMVLLPEGIVLSEAHVARLKKWGVEEIYVEGEAADGDSGSDIVGDIKMNEEFTARLEHKFEQVKEDPIMQSIYNAVKLIASQGSGE